MHLPVGLAVILDADAHQVALSKRMQQSWKELSTLNQQNVNLPLFGSFLTCRASLAFPYWIETDFIGYK